MKPQIQNNLNYAYFEDPRNIPGYCNNQIVDLDQKKYLLTINQSRPFTKIMFQIKLSQKKEQSLLEKVCIKMRKIYTKKWRKKSMIQVPWTKIKQR